ncbi:nucleotidyltransferase family protein [Candidatus Peregrinibacteria bacterium]|nr:nucleotidyltransferase family protein [Candidatus Peregrinibacteria bacterium]
MKALILGAGYATRLYPLTKDKPKALLPVGGVPILERTLQKLMSIPMLDRIYLVTNHRFEQNFRWWLKNYGERVKPRISAEVYDDNTASNDDRLGALGDINFVIDKARIDDDLLVVAGDNLFDFDLMKFVGFAKEVGTSICLYDFGKSELVRQYGVVTINKEHKVIDFEEKPPRPASTLISMGIYFFARKDLGMIKQYISDGHNADAPGFYLQWLHKEIYLYGYVIPGGTWLDIGDIDSYNKANELYNHEC